ncbi:unnamed protein product [Rotaria sp. Silwood1]|nr:unnamed protein product [Rotaria sp. Silwood1]CAF4509393.1 unnamed protein product [Rotaria sp. Silwood1]CAF4699304.1 unnamed protein product [Rotaria sp. Silwood1]
MATPVPPIDDCHANADDHHLEIFCLIWLDANISVEENRDTEQRLRSIINNLIKFQDVNQCQKYIEERSHKDRLIMIVSGQAGREIVPSIHKLQQVVSIYVYCMDKNKHEQWARTFAKVKAVVVKLDELIFRIGADHRIQKIVEEPLSINIFTTSTGAGTSTMGVNGQFVYSQLLIECLLRLKYIEADKQELIHLCKQKYESNITELNNLHDFEKNYSPNKALWWYTRESFFYKTLNTALRTQDIHLIFLFRVFIFDLYNQLKKYQTGNTLRVYRSQMMSSDELEPLKQCHGQLISVNSFFSTSTDKQKALSFLNISDVTSNLESVLFEIDADHLAATTKPFADISPHSAYPSESEILFMLGSIFRLKNVDRSNDGQVWIIRMTLCSDNEHELKHVLMDMKQKLESGETNLRTLGKLLSEMNKSDLAEKYFIRFTEQLSLNNSLLDDLYEDLGKIAARTGNLDKGMEWRKKAIVVKKQRLLTGKQPYHSVYQKKGYCIETDILYKD